LKRLKSASRVFWIESSDILVRSPIRGFEYSGLLVGYVVLSSLFGYGEVFNARVLIVAVLFVLAIGHRSHLWRWRSCRRDVM
jgi:hypothetical protein